MDLRKLKTVIDLVAESDISVLEVTEGDGKVRIVKTPPAPEQPVVYAAPPAETAVVAPAAAPAAGADAAPAAEPSEEQYDVHTVLAPILGTFYRAPSPGAAPVVERVQTGQEVEGLCIGAAFTL